MTSFDSFPPVAMQGSTFQGPTASGLALGQPGSSPSSGDGTTNEVLAQLMTESKHPRYKNVGTALIGGLFDVIGSIFGGKSIGRELFGEIDPDSTKNLTYLLSHMMSTKQAEKEMNRRFEQEKERMQAQIKMQDTLHLQQTELEKLKSRLETGRDAAKIEAGAKAQKDLMSEENKFKAGQTEKEIAARKEMNSQDNATKLKDTEMQVTARTSGGSGEGAKLAARAQGTSAAYGPEFLNAAKTDAPGMGIINTVIDQVGSPNFAAALQKTQADTGVADPLQAMKLNGFDPDKEIPQLVQQAGAAKASLANPFGAPMDESKTRATKVAKDLAATNPAYRDNAEEQKLLLGSVNIFTGHLGQVQAQLAAKWDAAVGNLTYNKGIQDKITTEIEKHTRGSTDPINSILSMNRTAWAGPDPERKKLEDKYGVKDLMDTKGNEAKLESLTKALMELKGQQKK